MKSMVSCFLVLSTVLACSKKEDVKLGCDCEGPSQNVVRNALAIHNISGVRILEKSPSPGQYAAYCNPAVLEGKAIAPQDTVYVSGIIRPVCSYGDFNYQPRIEVIEIKKK